MARKKTAEGGGSPAWMATFADMMSLLLTFFVLLLSFATMDVVKFRDALGSIQTALGSGVLEKSDGLFQNSSSPAVMQTPSMPSPPKQDSSSDSGSGGHDNEKILQQLEELITENGMEKDVTVEDSKRGVILKVQGRMFFAGGTAELKSEAHPIMAKIAEMMNEFPHKIAIEGHTDNVPISGGKYSSNWELSTARAVASLKYLKENHGVDVERIHVGGFADTRPVASNETEEGRAKNRRVEFVFYEE